MHGHGVWLMNEAGEVRFCAHEPRVKSTRCFRIVMDTCELVGTSIDPREPVESLGVPHCLFYF